MLNLSNTDIGIESPKFYIPAQSCSLYEYLRNIPRDFTFQRMKSVWQKSYFEDEFYYRFLTEQIATWNRKDEMLAGDEADRFVIESGIERIHFASNEMSSQMAILAARKVLEDAGYMAHRVSALIYYHSTLNQDPFKSIACQLQHELGLKKAFVSSLSQSGGNASLLAVKVASEALIAEKETDLILLVGSEKLVEPYQRLFGNITAISDSASGMLVKRRASSFRILAIHVCDIPEWWHPYNQLETMQRGFNDYLASMAALLLEETIDELRLVRDDVAVVLPPNLSLAFAKSLSNKAHIPERKILSTNISRFGHLLTSDLAANIATVVEEKGLKTNDLILALNVGFGLSMGCMALRV